jgi:hypothetical protein
MKHSRIAASIVLALAAAPLAGGAGVCSAAEPEADQPDCPKGDAYVNCMAAAGDRMAIYVQGRTAYESARETGDFSVALRLSRQLAAQGDKNGERLLKMTYMQLGWGAHKDYPQSYVWLSEGIKNGDGYLVRWRDMLTERMSPEQLAQAKARLGD